MQEEEIVSGPQEAGDTCLLFLILVFLGLLGPRLLGLGLQELSCCLLLLEVAHLLLELLLLVFHLFLLLLVCPLQEVKLLMKLRGRKENGLGERNRNLSGTGCVGTCKISVQNQSAVNGCTYLMVVWIKMHPHRLSH